MSGAVVPAAAKKGPPVALRLARDDRLARMAAAGDARAFAVIYERYHQPIYRYCHSILHDPDDAADALQNAMLKAMRGLDGNERAIALKPWLFRIAHNEAISLVRRRRPATTLDAFEGGPQAHSADEDAATRERLTQLVADLRELPDRQRGALLMRELGGLGFAEIGEVFGVSPAAAKQTVYEARTALHEYVEGRQMQCEEARQSLSAGDRRMLRGRKLSAHLRDCPPCRDFQELMRLRRRDVAALAPPISAATSAAVLQGLLGGGGGGATGGGLAGWLAGSGAKALAGSQAAKSGIALALVTASAGAIGVMSALEQDGAKQSAAAGPAAAQTRAAPDTEGGLADTGSRAGDRRGRLAHHSAQHTRTATGATGATRRAASSGGRGGDGGTSQPRQVAVSNAPSTAPSSTSTTVSAPVDAPTPPPIVLPSLPQVLTPAVQPPPTVATLALPVLVAAPQVPAP